MQACQLISSEKHYRHLINIEHAAEAVAQRCSVKKVFLENSLRPAILLKKRLWHRCFPVNFVKFPTAPFAASK